MPESARLIAGIAVAVVAVPIVDRCSPVVATAAIGSVPFSGLRHKRDRPVVDESVFAREIALSQTRTWPGR